jgi:hypothetical protein
MRRYFPPASLPILLLTCLGVSPATADDLPPLRESERALAARVDEHLARAWAEAKVTPSRPADDAEFLRRVSLDIAGKIPTAAEARAFLDDPRPDKRARLVDRLLRGPAATNHAVNAWKGLLIPEANGNVGIARFLAPDFEAWLRRRLADETGLDVLVRDLLTTPVDGQNPLNSARMAQPTEPTPLAYYAAKGYRPEDLAAGAARLFLGVRIECAQCHDHPFSAWKREEFWGLAATFAGFEPPRQPNAIAAVREDRARRALEIPGTGRKVPARFLDGAEPPTDGDGTRAALAKWITARDNPYFARAMVNRAWAQLFGVGLVDPVDDFGDSNPPSHPELLDDLAGWFAESGFDRRALIRALTATRAYALSSASGPGEPPDPRLFARGPVRGMSPEQLYDSLAQAVGLPFEVAPPQRGVFVTGPKAAFLEKFAAGDERPTERETSIPQALAFLHGSLVADATSLERGETLGAVVEAPFLDTAGRIETLFLAALTRRPTAEESARLVAYVEGRDPKAALADVFWALLNSAEFKLNH